MQRLQNPLTNKHFHILSVKLIIEAKKIKSWWEESDQLFPPASSVYTDRDVVSWLELRLQIGGVVLISV